MKRHRNLLHRLLFPGPLVVGISVPIAAALLVYTFGIAGDAGPIAYLSYAFSAWSLTLVCVNLVPVLRKIRDAVHRNPCLHRYLTDLPFKEKVLLYRSLSINVLYAALKFVSGVRERSVWLVTLAVYYAFLAAMRFLLLRQAHRNTLGQNLIAEFRRYRLCGAVLMMMNLALSGMTVLVIRQNKGFAYPGYLIYAMALYTFYTTVTAVVNLVKYRRLGSPVLSAAKAINLAAALVSMLALETAMLAQFNTKGPAFSQRMTGATSAAVCMLVLTMAMWMLVRSTRQLRQLERTEERV